MSSNFRSNNCVILVPNYSCWENLACDSDEGKRLALFRPLLLYIACTAKNMVQVNSFYLCDIGLIDF
jgi:hypothetical protein